ncbi:MAG: hypothetical protein HYZ50_21345 [Deltaproteobacteria bacterium]|nr:hypothetical protein [Deltaproteobacteria bacterium]
MSDFRHSSYTKMQTSDKSQPRRLSQHEAAQRCSWLQCKTRATSEHKNQVYCASHLLKVLQKQWQE